MYGVLEDKTGDGCKVSAIGIVTRRPIYWLLLGAARPSWAGGQRREVKWGRCVSGATQAAVWSLKAAELLPTVCRVNNFIVGKFPLSLDTCRRAPLQPIFFPLTKQDQSLLPSS